MGLDMWLRAQTKLELSDEHTGVCSGLFGIIPDPEGKKEIGYWRKAHEQREVILKYVGEDGQIDKEGVNAIIKEAQEILDTHSFDEDGFDITDEAVCCGTWQSKFKWEETIKFFTTAQEILDKDPEAKIYYVEWY